MKMPKMNFKGMATRLAGVSLGSLAFAAMDKQTTAIDPLIKAGVGLVVGTVLPPIVSKKPGGFIEKIGDGIIAASAISLGRKLAPQYIGGPSDVVYVAGPYGTEPYSGAIAGPDDITTIASM